ncbi:MAG TPA: DUF2637 domain-containing protein [Cellulomonas sp.]
MLIAGLAFWLSVTALTNLAERSGVAQRQAWAWPLIVDGLIVVATIAVVALDRKRAAWYPWLLLMAGTLVSVTANALHATVAADPSVPGLLAGCVAAVPPLVLLASTHLTVVLVRSHRAPRDVPSEVSSEEPEAGEDTVASAVPTAVGVLATDAASEPGDRRELAARLRVGGWSNKAIARELGVAPSTVGRWFPKTDTPAETTGATEMTARAEALDAPDWQDNQTSQEELTA